MLRNGCVLLLVSAAILAAHDGRAITETERARAIQETERGLRSAQTDAAKPMEQHGARDVTGLEWLQLSIGERMDQVVMSLYVLEKYGYTVTRSPNDYYNAVEIKLKVDPGLYSKKLTNILASVLGKERE